MAPTTADATKPYQEIADAKWQEAYRAATAAGVWFIAFVATLAFAGYLGAPWFAVGMVVMPLPPTILFGALTVGAVGAAGAASRRATFEEIPRLPGTN